MKKVTFYHSVICPRCQTTKLLVARVLRERPGVEVTRLELFTNRRQARQDGVTSIPALVSADGRKLSGVILTPRRIRQFLDTLDTDA